MSDWIITAAAIGSFAAAAMLAERLGQHLANRGRSRRAVAYLTEVANQVRAAEVTRHLHRTVSSLPVREHAGRATPEHTHGPSRPSLPVDAAGLAPTGGVASTFHVPAGAAPRPAGARRPRRAPIPSGGGANASP
jgi:hypothetical protein